jgi:hypothetical protein
MKSKVATFKILALLAIASLALCLARAGVVDNFIEPLDLEVEVDCDGDLTPEDIIQLSGGLHVLATETTDKSGGFHTTFHFQPVNVSGVGTLSGDTYRAVGLTRGSVTLSGDNVSDTFVNNFYMIGKKSGIKFLVHNTIHVSMVDGEVIVEIDNSETRCL